VSSNTPSQDKPVVPASNNIQPIKVQPFSPVDTVSILNRAKEDSTETRNETARNENLKKAQNEGDSSRPIGNVDFSYTFKGDLRVRFMDRGNRLIYQIPPELVARVEDTISQPNSSIDTKA
jgi:hypothetical protein